MQFKESILNYFLQTYGINKSTGFKMCCYIDVSPMKRSFAVSEVKKNKAFLFLKEMNYEIGFNLKNKQINSLIYNDQISNVRSFKFKALLPINGQRNATNGKTAKKQAQIMLKLIKQRSKVSKNITESVISRRGKKNRKN
jgi:ribosomal protein S13